jgi:hypothetical protein
VRLLAIFGVDGAFRLCHVAPTVVLNAQVEVSAEILPRNDVDALVASGFLEAYAARRPTRRLVRVDMPSALPWRTSLECDVQFA